MNNPKNDYTRLLSELFLLMFAKIQLCIIQIPRLYMPNERDFSEAQIKKTVAINAPNLHTHGISLMNAGAGDVSMTTRDQNRLRVAEAVS